MPLPAASASKAQVTSESEGNPSVETNPFARASFMSCKWLMRLPLWASATSVSDGVVRKIGWEFSQLTPPAVE